MRNIKLNESSVLQEYFRIAEEKNLLGLKKEAEVKVAAQPRQNPLVVAMNQLNNYWARLLKKMPEDRAKPFFDAALNKTILALKKKYNDPASHKIIDQFFVEAQKITQHEEAEDGMVVGAAKEDKFYDVTGETGEQLVDSAHPGNMRTELTHSKTDENLVETIVEQQKADLEVAHKVPKGVYAALTDLADKLDKLGYRKEADVVDDLIKKASGA